jgi:hypothetical protein
MAQLYPQALGSLFIASYDSQVYGGGIRPRLHTGLNCQLLLVFRYIASDLTRRPLTMNVLYCCVFVGTCLSNNGLFTMKLSLREGVDRAVA